MARVIVKRTIRRKDGNSKGVVKNTVTVSATKAKTGISRAKTIINYVKSN